MASYMESSHWQSEDFLPENEISFLVKPPYSSAFMPVNRDPTYFLLERVASNVAIPMLAAD
jgi:hypothetical protein